MADVAPSSKSDLAAQSAVKTAMVKQDVNSIKMKTFKMLRGLTLRLQIWMAVLLLLAGTSVTPAAVIGLNGDDSAGVTAATSSFTAAGHWSNATAPNPTNDYTTTGHILRAPYDNNSYTFAGNSLTLNGPGVPLAGGGRLICGQSGNLQVLTINNLIVTNFGMIQNAGSPVGLSSQINGVMTVTNGGLILLPGNGPIVLSGNVAGSGPIWLGQGGGNSAYNITFSGDMSSFTGNFVATNWTGSLVFSNNGSETLSGSITMTNGSLVQSGSGKLWLHGNNAGMSGTLTISAGSVYNYNSHGLGTMNVAIAAGSYFSFWTGGTFAGNFTLNGIDQQTKNTLYADNNQPVILSGGVILNGTSDVGTYGSGSLTFNGPVSGAGGLITQGGIVLKATNTFTGGLTINAGTLSIGGAGQLGGGIFNAGITNKGVLNYTSSANQTLSGTISGSGSLIQRGPGTLTLAGVNTCYGSTIVNGGTLGLSSNTALGNVIELTIAAGATLDVSALNAFSVNPRSWLNASGTGTVVGGSAANIKGAPGGTVSLPSCPIDLTYDGQNPALYLSQGGLLLNANMFIVNTASPLAPGTYPIIKQASGNIVGSGPFQVAGTAIGAGTIGSIVISGGNVNLVIQSASPTNSLTTYATWCMIWNDHNQPGWNATNYQGATSFMGYYPAIDWANTNYLLASLDFVRETGVGAVICDLSNGWGWLNGRVQYIQSLAAAKAMQVCVSVGYQSLGFFETNQCVDVWNLFAGPSAPNAATYLVKEGKPVIVCYCTRSQFDTLFNSTGTNRQNFTLEWASGEDSNVDKWGWQLEPFVGAISSTNSVYVTPSIKWSKTIPDSWRKSQAWLDYSFSVAKMKSPAFIIAGAFDDMAERNGWIPADTSGCTNGQQMRDLTGAINPTNYLNRVRQWISGGPSTIPGGLIPDGYYMLTNRYSQQLLDLTNSLGSGAVGLPLIQSTAGTNLDHYFMFYHLGSNVYRIISLNSGLSLESPGSSSGAQIKQDWDSPALAQRWTLVPSSNGGYYIQNVASGEVLDVQGAATAGSPVLQNPMTNGDASQQWTFSVAPGNPLWGGHWAVDTNGNWGDPTEWTGGTMADGSASTAIFDLPLTAARTVTLDSSRTVGNLVFGNPSTYDGKNWTLNGSSTLALDNSGSAPTITCWPLLGAGNSSSTISAPMSGVNGLTKQGTGTLWLQGNNSGMSGTLMISAGRVFNNNSQGLGTMDVAIAAGSYLSFWAGGTFAGNFTLNGIGQNIDGQTKNTLYADNNQQVTLNGSVLLNATSDVGGYGSGSITFNGPVSGAGGLVTQIGVGLNGSNTFTGGLTISAGTLALNGLIQSASSLLMSSNATLQIALGAPGGPTNIVVNGNVTLVGQIGVSDFGVVSNTSYPVIYYSGSLTNQGITVAASSQWMFTLDTNTPHVVYLSVTTKTSAPQGATGSQNTSPVLNPIADCTLNAGQTLALTNTASDSDSPPQILTFSLLASPTGMTINSTNGIIDWRPTVVQSPSTNLVTVQVTDNGTPALSAAQSFQVTVAVLVRPTFTRSQFNGGVFSMRVDGSAGPDYYLQSTTNLTPPITWRPLQTNFSATPPFLFTDPTATNCNRRFYRVLLGP